MDYVLLDSIASTNIYTIYTQKNPTCCTTQFMKEIILVLPVKFKKLLRLHLKQGFTVLVFVE